MKRKPLLLLIVPGIGAMLAVSIVIFLTHRAAAPAKRQDDTTKQSTEQHTSNNTEPDFNKAQYSLTDPTSPWVIVNKQHPIAPKNYAPSDLTSVGNGQQMRAEAASALAHMFADAQAAGYTLVADSGYRSYDTQVATYSNYVKTYGQTYTDTVSAHPGYSEHQTGWAIDIGTGSCHIEDCFGDTPGGKWTQANAYKYGFLLRYPPTLTSITGYSNEAWHFRYVGTALSNELHDKNIQTLEQFFDVTGGTAYAQ